jgi:hypothetical protein
MMFERECELFEPDKEKNLGSVILRIVYDDDVYGARIVADRKDGEAESEEDEEWTTVCNHLIAIQTTLTTDHDVSCKWSALDFSMDPPTYRSFEAVFATASDAQDFKDTFYEGKELADQSEILELPANNMENPENYYYGEGGDDDAAVKKS